MISINKSGEEQRPNISRIVSQENELMPEKIHLIMSKYLPKDINSIQSS